MNKDMTVPCADGIINIRVGAIIMKNGKLLMVGGDGADYLVSVGGRVKFGETAEESIIREVEEETGVRLEIDRLAFVHENYYYGDVPSKQDKLVYELSFFFLMKVPDGFEPISYSFMESNSREYLCWVAPDTEKKIYPSVFRTLSAGVPDGVQHIVTDERKN